MTPTPVGMRCPECARQRTKVQTMQSTRGEPRVTVALIILCAVVFLATNGFSGGSGQLWNDLLLFGPAVDNGDWWRLVTSGFLHAGPIHILFNMYLLWILGNLLEPTFGSRRFAALYFTSLLAGACGALIVEPNAPTVGASGAVFGLMGAAAVELRSRGVNPFKTDIGLLIVVNLILSFAISHISVGGHVGGLIGGVLAGIAFDQADRRRMPAIGYVGCFVLSAIAVVGALQAAG
jgi:membrane associated rhomboid family serine protease